MPRPIRNPDPCPPFDWDRVLHLGIRGLCVVAGLYIVGQLAAWWVR